MKKKLLNKPGIKYFKYLGISLLITFPLSLKAQISEGGIPLSFGQPVLKSAAKLPVLITKDLNIKQLLAEDKEFPEPYRHTKYENVSINIKLEGIKTEMKDYNGSIWRYKVSSSNAKALQIKFKTFYIPDGAKLFLYNPDYSKILGAFTSANNHPDSTFAIAALEGKDLIVEYFEPDNKAFNGKLIIGSVGQAYKDILISNSEDAEGYIGINCPEGENWQNQKHAVCLISFQIGQDGYSCSGSLINNVKEDGTPYFLTANHCINEDNVAKTVVVYFNYEEIGCNGPTSDSYVSLSGAELLSTGTESDYSLLLLNTTPPNSYEPFYAGWDVSGNAGTSAAGIHHPNGYPKKISVENSTPVSYDNTILWDNDIITPRNSHWEVKFDAGKTYGGSSGSPLFNNNGRIIGQLHGGGDFVNYYGKISLSWVRHANGFETMKSYLDPDTTGSTTLDGYYPLGNLPDPQVITEFSPVCSNAPVQLKGTSAFNPTGWSWKFSPASVTFVDGTNENSKDPVVLFTENTSYNIELIATNAAGTDSGSFENMITVDTNLDIQILPVFYTDSCISDFQSLALQAYGATDFKWSIEDSSADIFYFQDTTSNPATIQAYDNSLPSTSTEIKFQVKGSHGSCSTEKSFTFPLYSQENDDIADAIQIFNGQNGEFSNRCASVQDFEPAPPVTSCTGQNSWCDEFGTGEDIVGHSVWFYFIAESDEDLEISSKGMDNQIAVYEAESAFDILAGNYTLIGANDDYRSDDPNPFIETLKVKTGQKYWVQVDGSFGNIEGYFYLYLGESALAIKNPKDNSENIKIYPQPASDQVIIDYGTYTESSEDLILHVINSAGVQIFNKVFSPQGKSKLTLDVTSWDTGIYIVQLIVNNQLFNAKLIIE